VRPRSEWQGDELRLVLEDVEPELEQAIRELAFAANGRRFERTFKASAQGAEEAAQRFPAVAEEMVFQTAALRPVPWERALETLVERAGSSGVRWWLTGSAALTARGLSIRPRDLDLITDAPGAVQLAQELLELLVEPLAPGGALGAWWGRAFVGARIEWLGDVRATVDADAPSDFGPAAASRLESVMWRGHELRVPPLQLQLEVSERRGLHERARLIREALR
jgi:hypothetical protein